MNLNEYAAHRKDAGLRGTSHVAVLKAINSGRMPILLFSKITEMGTSMYRGERMRPKQATPDSIGQAVGQHQPGRSK